MSVEHGAVPRGGEQEPPNLRLARQLATLRDHREVLVVEHLALPVVHDLADPALADEPSERPRLPQEEAVRGARRVPAAGPPALTEGAARGGAAGGAREGAARRLGHDLTPELPEVPRRAPGGGRVELPEERLDVLAEDVEVVVRDLPARVQPPQRLPTALRQLPAQGQADPGRLPQEAGAVRALEEHGHPGVLFQAREELAPVRLQQLLLPPAEVPGRLRRRLGARARLAGSPAHLAGGLAVLLQVDDLLQRAAVEHVSPGGLQGAQGAGADGRRVGGPGEDGPEHRADVGQEGPEALVVDVHVPVHRLHALEPVPAVLTARELEDGGRALHEAGPLREVPEEGVRGAELHQRLHEPVLGLRVREDLGPGPRLAGPAHDALAVVLELRGDVLRLLGAHALALQYPPDAVAVGRDDRVAVVRPGLAIPEGGVGGAVHVALDEAGGDDRDRVLVLGAPVVVAEGPQLHVPR
mmetsp:Transcript_57281/g.168184  ORF Transcript_57281/g.168184 Transcript_57281/m.168184 type:complete len:470 (+) Transcript_57281:695-2104(+)